MFETGIVERPLLRTPLVAVTDVTCHVPDGHPGVEVAADDLVLLTRRGTYAMRPGTTTAMADPTRAVLLARDTEYRVRHPVPGGDRTTAFAAARTVRAELGYGRPGALPNRGLRTVPAEPDVDVRHRHLVHALAAGALDQLTAEVATLGILAGVAATAGIDQPAGSGHAATPRARAARAAWVARAQAYLAARLAEPVSLADVAGHVAVSPFHLVRVFRAHTGLPIHRYHLRLRVRAASERLVAGERDIARLAVDLGFADHSHLTRAVLRETGVTPSAIRAGAHTAAAAGTTARARPWT